MKVFDRKEGDNCCDIRCRYTQQITTIVMWQPFPDIDIVAPVCFVSMVHECMQLRPHEYESFEEAAAVIDGSNKRFWSVM